MLQAQTKKFIAVLAIIVLIPTIIFGGIFAQSRMLKHLAHGVSNEYVTQLVSEHKLDKDEAKNMIVAINEFSEIYIDSMGWFAKDPTPRLSSWYEKHKEFLYKDVDKKLSKKDRESIAVEIKKFQKHPPKEYFSLPVETQKLIDEITQDAQKHLDV